MRALRASLLLYFTLLACACSVVQAQERAHRIGFLGETTSEELARHVDALKEGLRALGYEDGRQYFMVYRWAERKPERLPAQAAELVAGKVDVIVTHGSAGARAARGATATIPIVAAVIGDPVVGGNVTGLALQEFEATVKWLDVLKQMLPPGSRIGWLDVPTSELTRKKEDEAARARGFEVQRVEVRGAGDLPLAFERFSREAHAVVVPNSPLLDASAALIARLATTYRLPTAGSTALARAGGLVGYGADEPAMYRRAARYVDAVLKGARAGEMPMEAPPKHELTLNLKTARTLGIRIPPELLEQADNKVE